MRCLYNISIFSYYLLILAASLVNKKAGLWLRGRKRIFSRLKTAINPDDKIVWFHCSSLGEFEQGRPVIEAYKIKYPQHKILLTFFSPSGYEIRKDYKQADYVFYLPLDTKANAKKFIDITKPEKAFFIKYEYWYNYLNILHKKDIPVYMVSAIYRKEQHFFKWYGFWFRNHLKNIKHIFVQNDESVSLLNKIGINQVTVSGDTRFDRVSAILKDDRSFPLIEQFVDGSKVLMAGSSWEKDEDIIKYLFLQKRDDLKFIIAPHLIDDGHINTLISKFEDAQIRYSELVNHKSEDIFKGKRVLIIDSIGILSYLYKYCNIAYIGGGFGSGIHNILEAAVFGKPVIFGPNYYKFGEALDLASMEGAFSIKDKKSFVIIADKLLKNEMLRSKVSEICKNYVKLKTGATDIILNIM